ncbi:MAG: transglycosylase SLT domain-containing protein [Bacteroidota bacterium]
MKRVLLTFCLIWSLKALGATPQVPSGMSLADIRLKLTATGKKRVQEMVNSLTRSEKYFQILLDRANLFVPIVARVLKEENVPSDLKYLVMQESGLIADAVSKSNAVGFWQFKDFTAAEVGLQISGHVDERMHITAATRGAAKYLKIHNEYLNNWFYSMLAYKDGRGHVERNTNYKKYKGAKRMRIDGRTHWYIIHFLAYKVVFEGKIGQERHPELCLHEYEKAHGKTLGEIAQEFGVDQAQLKEHNKWLKRHRVPHDTTCATIIPLTHEQYARRQDLKTQPILEERKIDYAKYGKQPTDFPVITTQKDKKTGRQLTIINGIPGTVAQAADSLDTLAQVGNISVRQLLDVNELDQSHEVLPGQVYYFKAKESKADTHFHIVRHGETWWSIAQQYGIKKRQLLLKNRLRQEVALQSGRVLWLRFIRPRHIPVAYKYEP